MVPLGIMLIVALRKQDVGIGDAVDTAVAGMVTLVPEGLILLVSVTYAAAALRMARAGALSQQLNAIESLASVDTICVDKTGTLTTASLRLVEVLPAPGTSAEELDEALGRYAASSEARNLTLDGDRGGAARDRRSRSTRPSRSSPAGGGAARRSAASATCSARPSSSRSGSWPRSPPRTRRPAAASSASGSATAPFPDDPDAGPPPLRPLGLAVLAEELRRETRETIAFLLEQGVEIVVLSGDAARDGGLDRDGRRHPGSRAAARRRRRSRRAMPSSTASRGSLSVVGPHLAGGKAAGRRVAAPQRALRGDGRGRRQRRARR